VELETAPVSASLPIFSIMSSSYIGRFAPSPSGDLHFGSLIAALGSYLQARAEKGLWRVRIEDIDPPREVPGAATRILHQLDHYGLEWDGEVLWQSQRHDAYRAVLNDLQQQGLSYYCTCTRRRIQQAGGHYDGHCRTLGHGPERAAVRLNVDHPVTAFEDGVRGRVKADPQLAHEDFIIHRRDGLFAYNLAVVVDDHFQGITEIVRGADLIEPTVRQMTLYHLLGWDIPRHLHLPLVLNHDGNKLSKQNHAPALPGGDPRPPLVEALRFLGQPVPTGWQDLTTEKLLQQAIAHWACANIPINDARLAHTATSAFSNGSL